MKFTKKILSNGLTVLHEKRDVPVTTVMLASKFGAVYETSKEKGIAHVMEHMAFKGTLKRSAFEIAFEVEKLGGNLNAFTDETNTSYLVKLPSEHLERAMDIIFDIFFNPIYPAEELEKEKNVICEEIKMYHDDPRRYVVDKVKECLYKEPFGTSIAGTEETVRAFTREELIKKHNDFYSTENAILSVVGNNSFEEVVRFAEKFSKISKHIEKNKPKIKFQNINSKEQRDNLQQANICIGFRIPVEQKYSAEVFSTILGDGMSSKLFTEVREKRGLAYAVKTYNDINSDYGHLVIYIGTEKKKIDEVIKICLEEFKKMKNISERELIDGKKQVIGNFEVSNEDSSNVALNLIQEEIDGDAKDFYEFEKNINRITLKDIQDLAEIKDYAVFTLSP